MSKKKTLTIGLSIVAVCLLIVIVYMATNRSEKREPTVQELAAYEHYSIDWQDAVGTEGPAMEIILSLCVSQGEQTIGDNVYEVYISDTLGQYLYDFGEMMQIAMLRGTTLYVQYTTPAGDMITLGYDADGQCEKSVYDSGADTLYYETRDTAEVWTKFRNGFQWGA